MKIGKILFGLYMAATPACTHSVKPAPAPIIKPAKDTLTLKIEEEGRACLRKIKECPQKYLDENPYALEEEVNTACGGVRKSCLEEAANRLNAE